MGIYTPEGEFFLSKYPFRYQHEAAAPNNIHYPHTLTYLSLLYFSHLVARQRRPSGWSCLVKKKLGFLFRENLRVWHRPTVLMTSIRSHSTKNRVMMSRLVRTTSPNCAFPIEIPSTNLHIITFRLTYNLSQPCHNTQNTIRAPNITSKLIQNIQQNSTSSSNVHNESLTQINA